MFIEPFSLSQQILAWLPVTRFTVAPYLSKSFTTSLPDKTFNFSDITEV